MRLAWNEHSWEGYLEFQSDSKKLEKINKLIRDIHRAGPTGKPPAKAELLKGDGTSLRSVRIDKKNRLTYAWRDGELFIVECGGHYGDH